MLCGYPPFYAESEALIFKLILCGHFEFPDEEWKGISKTAKDFIRRILVVDPTLRPSAAECLQDPWLSTKAPDNAISPQTLKSLKRFYDSSRIRQRFLGDIAKQLSAEELESLRTEFRLMDLNNDGILSADEILKAIKTLDAKSIAGLESLVKRASTLGGFALDWDAFCKAAADRRSHLRRQRVAEIFKQLDVDGNGKLSIAEITKAMHTDRQDDAKLAEEFHQLDTNRDGELDFEEVMRMIEVED